MNDVQLACGSRWQLCLPDRLGTLDRDETALRAFGPSLRQSWTSVVHKGGFGSGTRSRVSMANCYC